MAFYQWEVDQLVIEPECDTFDLAKIQDKDGIPTDQQDDSSIDSEDCFDINVTVYHGNKTVAEFEPYTMQSKNGRVENLLEDLAEGFDHFMSGEMCFWSGAIKMSIADLNELAENEDVDYKAEVDGKPLDDNYDLSKCAGKHVVITMLFKNDTIDNEKAKIQDKAQDNDIDDDDDGNDEWQQVYDTQNIEINSCFGKFYKTYGGGPEGGYFVSGDKLYSIDRTWGQPWHLERIFGMKLHLLIEPYPGGKNIQYLKVVDIDTNDSDSDSDDDNDGSKTLSDYNIQNRSALQIVTEEPKVKIHVVVMEEATLTIKQISARLSTSVEDFKEMVKALLMSESKFIDDTEFDDFVAYSYEGKILAEGTSLGDYGMMDGTAVGVSFGCLREFDTLDTTNTLWGRYNPDQVLFGVVGEDQPPMLSVGGEEENFDDYEMRVGPNTAFHQLNEVLLRDQYGDEDVKGFIFTLNGQNLDLNDKILDHVRPNCVLIAEPKIQDKEGIPPDQQREDKDDAFNEGDDEEGRMMVHYRGGRSGQLHSFKVKVDSSIRDFKHKIFANFHACEFEAPDEFEWTESHWLKTKGGKVLDKESLTWAEYDMQKSTVPWEVSLVPTLKSGMAKRARDSAATGSISNVVGTISPLATDTPAVTAALAFDSLDISSWVATMDVNKLAQLDKAVDKYSNTGASDTAIKAFAEFLPVLQSLQDEVDRATLSKTYVLAKFKKAYTDFITDDKGAKKPMRFHNAVKVRTALASQPPAPAPAPQGLLGRMLG